MNKAARQLQQQERESLQHYECGAEEADAEDELRCQEEAEDEAVDERDGAEDHGDGCAVVR